MRPEVVWRRTRRGRAWHSFVDGSDEPICKTPADGGVWLDRSPMRRLHLHRRCWQLCPWPPRLNAVMTEEQISRELD